MIHPINVPDDLYTPNPERPRDLHPSLFRAPRAMPVAGYGADGRAFRADGAPARGGIPPEAHWERTFLRSFIRRLAMDPDEAGRTRPRLVDIVDLSPKRAGSGHAFGFREEEEEEEADVMRKKMNQEAERKKETEGKAEGMRKKMSHPEEEGIRMKSLPEAEGMRKKAERKTEGMKKMSLQEAEGMRKKVERKAAMKTRSHEPEEWRAETMAMARCRVGSIPDRPPATGSSSSSADDQDDEAEESGDALARVGSTVRCSAPAARGSQRVSARAVRSVVARCCGGSALQHAEFARFDFSQAQLLLNNDKFEPYKEAEAELELFPEQLGHRLWTCRHRERPQADAAGAVRFSVSGVRIGSGGGGARRVRITMVAHRTRASTAATKEPTLILQIVVHVHSAQGAQVGPCVKVMADQMVALEPGKDTPFELSIQLDDPEIRAALKEGRFLVVTAHGKLSISKK